MSYASPDALNGQPPDPAMDVYTFAVIAYEIAMGRPAFDPKLPPMQLTNAIGRAGMFRNFRVRLRGR
jgi:hypothetical protein